MINTEEYFRQIIRQNKLTEDILAGRKKMFPDIKEMEKNIRDNEPSPFNNGNRNQIK